MHVASKQAEYAKFTTKRQVDDYLKSHLSKSAVIQSDRTPSLFTTQQPPSARKRPTENDQSAASSSKRPRDAIFEAGSSARGYERIVYCDGSALGNGRKGATAGIGIYWEGTRLSYSERVPGPIQTNNRAEMYAIARVLEQDTTPHLPLTIATDSEYCINCGSFCIALQAIKLTDDDRQAFKPGYLDGDGEAS